MIIIFTTIAVIILSLALYFIILDISLHRSKSFRASQLVLVVKNLSVSAGELRHEGSIPGLEDPWRRTWQPTQHSCLENPVGRGAWRAAGGLVTQSWTALKRLGTHAWSYSNCLKRVKVSAPQSCSSLCGPIDNTCQMSF